MDIRNYCIIAHIDHGKSTLADRMLELTKTVRETKGGQMLDSMELEQERGITIKMTPVRMQWKGVELNLIDTPGHVDFQYEVSRSLSAVEGVVLLVDASQGIQAQTLSTLYMALENDLTIIPVLNKIDLPNADPERVTLELEQTIGIDAEEIICVSAKTGENVEVVLDAVIERIKSPEEFRKENPIDVPTDHPLLPKIRSKALIFDSVFDPYKGVVVYVKVEEGTYITGKDVYLIYSDKTIRPTEVGYFSPGYTKDKTLSKGQIGYIITGQKSVRDAKIGDTIIQLEHHTVRPTDNLLSVALPGFETVTPFVFAGVYPIETEQYDKLKQAFEKLTLNDSAIAWEYEHSNAMGHGFRCGFLGMLHMDIIKERLIRERGMETIFTTPTVTYLVKSKYLKLEVMQSGRNAKDLINSGLYEYLPIDKEIKDLIDGLKDGSLMDLPKEVASALLPWLIVKSGSDMIDHGMIDAIFEPIVTVEIVGDETFSGNIMGLCQEYRGIMKGMEYLDKKRVVWKYQMPLGEIVVDFYDRLKSTTKGYATMNYDFYGYKESDLQRIDVRINSDLVEAFSLVVHKEKAYYTGRDLVKKLKELIPKHQFKIPIQAGIGTKMIARETISALKKDVLAKCYGGDISRKKKLLKKQKEGKKKMKMMGKVSVPGDVFMKMVQR